MNIPMPKIECKSYVIRRETNLIDNTPEYYKRFELSSIAVVAITTTLLKDAKFFDNIEQAQQEYKSWGELAGQGIACDKFTICKVERHKIIPILNL